MTITIHPPECICTRCCDFDAVQTSPIHEAERHESYSARAGLTEMERAISCGHFWRRGVCIYCSEVADGG